MTNADTTDPDLCDPEPCGESGCICYGVGEEHADCACGCDCPADTSEWQPGECDNCTGGDNLGITATGPLGPLYCACFIGQGADPDECRCGPPAEAITEEIK